MMKAIKLYSILTIVFLSVLATSCKKDEETPVPISSTTAPANEEELITSVVLSFVDTAGVQPNVTYAFRDPDGDGGNAPTVHDVITLAANTYYNATIQILNESVSPAEDITTEVQQEDDEHLFCYDISNTNVSVTRTDSDGTYEVGVTTFWSTGAAASGNTTVSLKHQPGVKDGTCAPGDTDVEVIFVTEIQ